LLPDIFDDLSSFQSWFDFSSIGEEGGEQIILQQEQQNQVVTKLHHILRPFLLRRVKEDVEIDIPKKQEKVIYTGLSETQHKYYNAIMSKQFEQVLSEQAVKQLRNRGEDNFYHISNCSRYKPTKHAYAAQKNL
jgi:ATP-dependent DNA helicase